MSSERKRDIALEAARFGGIATAFGGATAGKLEIIGLGIGIYTSAKFVEVTERIIEKRRHNQDSDNSKKD